MEPKLAIIAEEGIKMMLVDDESNKCHQTSASALLIRKYNIELYFELLKRIYEKQFLPSTM